MEFRKIEKTPFIYVTGATCPSCNAQVTPTFDETSNNRAVCSNCNTEINLRYAPNKRTFDSINLKSASCPKCKNKIDIDLETKRNGRVECTQCMTTSDIWDLKCKKYETSPVEINSLIDQMLDDNQIDAALALIETSIVLEQKNFLSSFNRAKWIYSFGETILSIFSFLPRWINIEKYLVAPIANLLLKIFSGKKLDSTMNNFISLVYRKVLLTANKNERINEWDLNLLLEEVYLLLILIESNDHEAFYNQINFYMNYTPSIKGIDRSLRIIEFYFSTSNKKDEDWMEIFWTSLSSVVYMVYEHSNFVKSVRGYYRHLVTPGQDDFYTKEQYFDDISKYEQVLGIRWSGNIADIKREYRKLVSIYHPDKKDGNEEKFMEIQEAYIFFVGLSS